jgi:hypothetical protein
VKRTIAAIAMLAPMLLMAGLVRADELEDAYTKLKSTVEKKDADAVKADAQATFKLAQVLVNAPQPSDAAAVDNWKQRVEYGKEVVAYTEYALAAVAAEVEGAKTIELVETLVAQNPKSKYIDTCTQAYLTALGKNGGAAKQMDGMTKIVAGRPDNEVALDALALSLMSKSPDRALVYANRLIKIKGPGVADGYYVAGVVNGAKNAWMDCDRDLKAALPLVHDNYKLGIVYFYLGLANYSLGKQTMDRPRMQAGLKYSQQSAAIAGPMKDQAYHNVLAIQNELGHK